MAADRRALIVGASVAGLGAACALASAGWDVTVVERRPDLTTGGRAFLLQPNGIAALASLGALEAVRDRALVVSDVRFYLDSAKPVAVYDYGELRHSHPYALEIRPSALRAALAQTAAEYGLQSVRFGCEALEALMDDGVVAGARVRERGADIDELADLVVAADGAGSRIRATLGIETRQLARPSRYVLATVDRVRATREIAVWCGAGYANGVCPLPDGTYFWDCVTDANRSMVDARDLAGWKAVYERRVEGAATFIDDLTSFEDLTVVDARTFWACQVARPGAVVVGDAAGAVHPHSAQGANLALEDAARLRTLKPSDARLTLESLGRHTRESRRKRHRYVLWSILAARSLDGPTARWRLMRRVGFFANRVAPMRRELLKRQAGLTR